MKQNETKKIELQDVVEMIGYMGRLDFSKRLPMTASDSSLDALALGLNMLSEELEANTVKRSMLEEANHNLESFSYTVAHDIRTPLNSSLGLISLMEYELKGKDSSLTEYLSLLKETLQRMSEMISHILDYSKAGFHSGEQTSIHIEKAVDALLVDYDKATLHVVVNPGLPAIKFNEFAFHQVLGNLISNAIKHNNKPVCYIEINCVENGGFHEISIKDNGPGIKHKYLETIFELFNNLDSGKAGSYGIGLSIVKKIITNAGGSIWAESEENEGTKITFTVKKE